MLRVATCEQAPFFAVLDDTGQEVAVIAGYLGYVAMRGFSHHTVRAYAYDMLAFCVWLDRPATLLHDHACQDDAPWLWPTFRTLWAGRSKKQLTFSEQGCAETKPGASSRCNSGLRKA